MRHEMITTITCDLVRNCPCLIAERPWLIGTRPCFIGKRPWLIGKRPCLIGKRLRLNARYSLESARVWRCFQPETTHVDRVDRRAGPRRQQLSAEGLRGIPVGDRVKGIPDVR